VTILEERALLRTWLARRDEPSFRALYHLHTPALYRFAVRLAGGARHEAEEAVHDAWVRAAARMDQFDGRSSLRTWLTGFVLNCFRELQRSAARATAPEPLQDGSGASPDGQLDLSRALAGLPDGYREVLLLHDLEGFNHGEIAQLLGIEAGTSKSQLSRARRAVRALLIEGEVENGT
jgi:RNA polymerase sigma factor (sigma-70 family)